MYLHRSYIESLSIARPNNCFYLKYQWKLYAWSSFRQKWKQHKYWVLFPMKLINTNLCRLATNARVSNMTKYTRRLTVILGWKVRYAKIIETSRTLNRFVYVIYHEDRCYRTGLRACYIYPLIIIFSSSLEHRGTRFSNFHCSWKKYLERGACFSNTSFSRITNNFSFSIDEPCRRL